MNIPMIAYGRHPVVLGNLRWNLAASDTTHGDHSSVQLLKQEKETKIINIWLWKTEEKNISLPP